jgi:hypothetical protein
VAPDTRSEEPSSAGKYTLAFEVQLPAESGIPVAACVRAYLSSSPEIAITRWETFLTEYVLGDYVEDITDLRRIVYVGVMCLIQASPLFWAKFHAS